MNDVESAHPHGNSDWHPADVLAALKKRGTTLAGLSVANGYHPTAAGKALKRQWPALEAIIADALELSPAQIWPSRYATESQPPGEAKP
jgi:Ner family transcriptional regulator